MLIDRRKSLTPDQLSQAPNTINYPTSNPQKMQKSYSQAFLQPVLLNNTQSLAVRISQNKKHKLNTVSSQESLQGRNKSLVKKLIKIRMRESIHQDSLIAND